MDAEKNMIRGKRLAVLFAFVYLASYMTRINFAAVINEVIAETGFSKPELSVILVCLSISYGIGQIINGRIGDKIKPQNLMLVGLATATLANFALPFFSSSIPAMSVLWTVNGFAQAMMWPPIVKIMVSTMDEPTYRSASVIVASGSSIGTVLVYLIAPLMISISGWKAMMFFSAAFGLVFTVIWFFLKDRTYSDADIPELISGAEKEKKQRFSMPRGSVLPFVFIALAIILQGMLRDGISSWMPTYLTENFGMPSEKSILYTVSLAIFTVITFNAVGAFYNRFFKNEVACAALIFGLAVIAGVILLIFFNGTAWIAIACMMLINGFMHGVNLMLISHVPKRFKKYGNLSTISGFINSFTYVGAAIATYGIAKLSEVYGWRATVAIWLVVSVLGTAACLIATPRWKKFIEK